MTERLKPVERPAGLRSRVYRSLRGYLVNGQWPPGTKLSENALAEALNVSRTPVREAMSMLANEGLLQPVGRSYRVPRLDPKDLDDILELRRLLEPTVIRHAARNATKAQIDVLNKAVARSRSADKRGDIEDFMRANRQVREAWIEIAANERLKHAVRLYDDHLQHLRVLSTYDPKIRRIIVSGQEAIADRIAAADPDGAEAALDEHMRNAEMVLRRALTKMVDHCQ